MFTSESFSEIMIRAANFLVETHRLHFNDEMVDKIIFLRMNKRFMERIRTNNYFSSVLFGNILSDANANVYFVVIILVLVNVVVCYCSFMFACQLNNATN